MPWDEGWELRRRWVVSINRDLKSIWHRVKCADCLNSYFSSAIIVSATSGTSSVKWDNNDNYQPV